MRWILRMIFPSHNKPVRISKDHLWGLKPPKVAPPIPKLPNPTNPPEPDIKELHKKFLLSGSAKPKIDRTKDDRGVWF